jgi:hypothetical protein
MTDKVFIPYSDDNGNLALIIFYYPPANRRAKRTFKRSKI